MKEHRPINYNQAPPTRANVTTSSETALHQSPVHEARAQVQHLAIESSDIVGWTADGRLIVQMPANQGMPEVGVATVNPAPIRRASTGKSLLLLPDTNWTEESVHVSNNCCWGTL